MVYVLLIELCLTASCIANVFVKVGEAEERLPRLRVRSSSRKTLTNYLTVAKLVN